MLNTFSLNKKKMYRKKSIGELIKQPTINSMLDPDFFTKMTSLEWSIAIARQLVADLNINHPDTLEPLLLENLIQQS